MLSLTYSGSLFKKIPSIQPGSITPCICVLSSLDLKCQKSGGLDKKDGPSSVIYLVYTEPVPKKDISPLEIPLAQE